MSDIAERSRIKELKSVPHRPKEVAGDLCKGSGEVWSRIVFGLGHRRGKGQVGAALERLGHKGKEDFSWSPFKTQLSVYLFSSFVVVTKKVTQGVPWWPSS